MQPNWEIWLDTNISPAVAKWTHHHPQEVEKKGFKEYFLEFLNDLPGGLRLAFLQKHFVKIFLKIHRQRNSEKLIQRNLFDSVTIHQKTLGRLEKEDFIKYIVQYVEDSDLVNLSPNFYPAFTSTFISTLTSISAKGGRSESAYQFWSIAVF